MYIGGPDGGQEVYLGGLGGGKKRGAPGWPWWAGVIPG